MKKQKQWLIFAWFIFSTEMKDGLLSPAKLESRHPYTKAAECADVARLLQAGRLIPYFYCVGNKNVDHLPELEPRPPVVILRERMG